VLRFVGVVDAVNGQVKAGLEKYVLGPILVSKTYSRMGEPGIPLITPLPLRLVGRTISSCSIQRGTARDLSLYKELALVQLSQLWGYLGTC
jgi:hypothetical protein